MRNNNGGDGMGVLGALFAGMAIGATAFALSDKRTRKRLEDTYQSWKEKGEEAVNDIRHNAQEMLDEGRARIAKTIDQTERKVKKAV